MRVGPVAFLLLVPGVWALVRGVMLWPGPALPPERRIAYASGIERTPEPARRGSPDFEKRDQASSEVRLRYTRDLTPFAETETVRSDAMRPIGGGRTSEVGRPDSARLASPMLSNSIARRGDRFDLSAWMLVRGDVAPGLAAAGQLGGNQAGVRARYRLRDGLHLAARLSGPLQARLGKEAAIAVDIRPVAPLPVTFSVERRIGLDRGGRDAFALGLLGGFEHALSPTLRFDTYGQAGLVGLKRRDGYVDGAARIERQLLARERVRIGIGAGVWGGAQPGVARLDIGPQLVVRVPVATGGVRIGAEWRQRVAGDARPASGPALSLGADF